MGNDKNKFQLLDLPEELIFLVASFLDKDSLLNFRLVNKLLEQISQHLFFNVKNNELGSDTIACGDSSVILARSNGQVWGWGSNWFNQLAFGDYSLLDNREHFTPKEGSLKDVLKVAMGNDFSLAIMKNGTVFSSGTNSYGELGLGDIMTHTVPKEIPPLKNATQIAAGFRFALATTDDGTLYSWGKNDCGQLGHGHKEDCLTPKVVSGITNIDKIAVGQNFSVALTKKGALYVWGRLGLELEDNCLLTPQEITTLEDVVSIFAGRNFIVALKSDGTVLTLGSNSSGQLGVGIKVPNLNDIVKISVNNSYFGENCLALSREGIVYSWNHSDVWSKTASPKKIIGLEKIVEIGQGLNFSVALDKDGMLYSLGDNECGQLGIREESAQCDTPTKAFSFGEPAKTQFFNAVTKRLVNERSAKTSLTPEQKAKIVEETESEVFRYMMKRS